MLDVRWSDDLPGWLAQRLLERFPGALARVLRVYRGNVARLKGLPGPEAFTALDCSLSGAPAPAAIDAERLEAIRTRAAPSVYAAAAGSRLLAALGSAGDVRYLVELTGTIPVEDDDADLAGFLAFVGKYFERLMDAETDPLTRLSNRRVFHSHVDAGLRRWTGSARPHFFAFLDIDHFKRINDSFGHLYGDEILVLFANVMRRTFRTGDMLYRFGGEEFVVIYSVQSGGGGEMPLERFRAAVEAYEFPSVGKVTTSAGFARIADASTPPATLIDRADQALYYAKAHGRNRVCSWDDLVASGELKLATVANKDVTLF